MTDLQHTDHTDHNEIQTRLTMWQTFFETGVESCPDDAAADGGCDIDFLLDLAREGDNSDLQTFADVTETKMDEYNDRMHALQEAINGASPSEIRGVLEKRRAKGQVQH